ncbi:MAG: hypothetical protein H0V92_11060 [Pseudonocardiales bacterium]|nr:hypothetical protein [Pseudonocardiales bacterium]
MPGATKNAAALAELLDTFTFAQATAAGMTKHALTGCATPERSRPSLEGSIAAPTANSPTTA